MRAAPGVNEITLTAESDLERDAIARWTNSAICWYYARHGDQMRLVFGESPPGPTPGKYTVLDHVRVKRDGRLATILSGPHVDGLDAGGVRVVYMVRDHSGKLAGLLDSEIEPADEPQ